MDIITFRPVELYFKNDAKKTLSRFAIVDNLPGMLDLLQIVLDSSVSGLSDVVGLDPAVPGKYINCARLADHYGLRKRNFYERIKNVKTYQI